MQKVLGAHLSDPRVAKVLDELGAKDNHRPTVATSLLPVEEPFIQQYIDNTTSPEHKYKLQVESVFKITRSGDREFKHLLPNHKLLFHGTTPEAVYPILRDGFRSALSLDTGMFGKGIYFTDCATKAANYTSKDSNKLLGAGDSGDATPGFEKTGYLFLAEVALGRINEYTKADPSAKALLNGADSVYCKGSYQPDGEYVMRETEPKVIIPMGELKLVGDLALKHNEWVVYTSTQIRHMYLVKVQIV
ncbi:Poly [ADP-ribose] polymerase [Aphelenchoides bicaudatus]|nr:Poly [ADP-ribose] polymerase [Aphelenchoides bicaudatus]